MRIRIEGHEELKKVSMDRAIRDHSSLGLKAAMEITDKLLAENVVEFEIDDSSCKTKLLKALEEANAHAFIVEGKTNDVY
jgi:hypothetical protein